MRNLSFAIFATSILMTAQVQALPVENADAFVAGDGKAIYETSSGLTWLDFGVINSKTYYDTTNELGSGQYSDWRLPTESEVLHLFKGLLPEFSVPDTATEPFAEQIQSQDFKPHWSEINSLWGINEAIPNLGQGNGHQLFSYSSIGIFKGDNGLMYGAGMHDFTFSANVSPGVDYYGQISLFNIYETDAYDEDIRTSTLLVRDSPLTIDVPEPSLLALFTLGFTGLLLNRLRRRNSYSTF